MAESGRRQSQQDPLMASVATLYFLLACAWTPLRRGHALREAAPLFGRWVEHDPYLALLASSEETKQQAHQEHQEDPSKIFLVLLLSWWLKPLHYASAEQVRSPRRCERIAALLRSMHEATAHPAHDRWRGEPVRRGQYRSRRQCSAALDPAAEPSRR